MEIEFLEKSDLELFSKEMHVLRAALGDHLRAQGPNDLAKRAVRHLNSAGGTTKV